MNMQIVITQSWFGMFHAEIKNVKNNFGQMILCQDAQIITTQNRKQLMLGIKENVSIFLFQLAEDTPEIES